MKKENINSETKIFSDRIQLIKYLGDIEHICEIGVGLGDFSKILIDSCRAKIFYGVDLFELHNIPVLWGKDTNKLFNNEDHFSYYKKMLKKYENNTKCEIIKKDSKKLIVEDFQNQKFGLVYIDGDHTYDYVINDLEIAKNIIEDNGVIILNDYTKYDPFFKTEYGVVDAVNVFINENPEYKITYLALDDNMFCDVALKKM